MPTAPPTCVIRGPYHGLRVYGGDIVIHTKANGDFAGASNGLAAPANPCRDAKGVERAG
jgi:hypothetical protein